MRSRFLRKEIGVHALRPFSHFTLPLFEAGSCLVVRFLGKAHVMWQRSTKLIHFYYQANHLPVKQLQNRAYVNRANHSDGEMFHQLDEATSPLRGGLAC